MAEALDPRRMFTRAEVWRGWELQGQVCSLCERRIPFDLMQGDHVIAWSKGGRTSMNNLQVLCGSCNLRKGSREQAVVEVAFRSDVLALGTGEPRQWQKAAAQLVLDRILREPVLVEACPGAGKTQFGLEIAYRLVRANEISRVIIVVPTIGIADNWNMAASLAIPRSPTLPLRSQRDWRVVDPIGDSWLGTVVTYQTLFASTEMLLAHATDPGQRTLVIFDEVHHAGANAAWGVAAQEAFARGARAILSLTGTPFRTNRDPIVFVPSEGGSAKPHFRYSYDEAIRDDACRPVQFVEARGSTTFRVEDGSVQTVTFDQTNLSPIGQRRRLLTALEWIGDGSIADKMIRDANSYLVALRKAGDSDAGGLVVCVDCQHAATVAEFMAHRVLGGVRPIVACSKLHDANDPQPANALKKFGESDLPWIVAVNMVSEGIDFPRLRAVVYLTNRLTLLSFRQIVGRVVRRDLRNERDHGRVYIPGDPRCLEMARTITDEVNLLPPPMAISLDSHGSTINIYQPDDHEEYLFESLASLGEQGNIFDTDGNTAAPLLISCARVFITQQGLQNTDPESLALAAVDNPKLKAALLAMSDQL